MESVIGSPVSSYGVLVCDAIVTSSGRVNTSEVIVQTGYSL